MSSTKLNHLCRLAEFQVDNTKSFASGQAAREQAQYENSFKELAEKRQLHQEPPYFSPIPVYIVKGDNAQDLKTLWKAVVALKGPSLAAPRYRDFLTSFDELDWSLQVEARSLSSFCRMAYSKGNGHDVQLTDFRDIIEAVEWVFSQWAFENWVTDSMSEDHFLDLSRSLIEFD